MKKIIKYSLLVLVFIFMVGCDQVSKHIARQELASGRTLEYLDGFLRFTYAENPGAFMGLGADFNEIFRLSFYFLSAVVVFAAVVLLFIFMEQLGPFRTIGLLVLLAGAGGNIIDRFANHGRVIDFIVIGTEQVHTGVLNLADICITTGLILFLISSQKRFRKKDEDGMT